MSSSSPRPWQRIERLFRFDHPSIEEGVEEGKDLYRGLDSRALYTSYADLYQIFSHPSVKGRWVDLGAGTGHTALMYALMFPERRAFAVEASASRLAAGIREKERLGIHNAQLVQGDLLHCPLPDGETYFLYFPTGPVLDRILDELRAKEHACFLVAIESHGDLLPRLMKEEWLRPVGTIPLSSSRHYPEAVVYEKIQAPLVCGPHQLSYREKFLLVQESDYRWLGESQGLEWLKEDQYQLALPPRTIDWEQVKEVLELDEVPEEIRPVLELRRLGELTIETPREVIRGSIRKIAVDPCFKLEISTGQWVKWNEIKRITHGERICFDRPWP